MTTACDETYVVTVTIIIYLEGSFESVFKGSSAKIKQKKRKLSGTTLSSILTDREPQRKKNDLRFQKKKQIREDFIFPSSSLFLSIIEIEVEKKAPGND